MSILNSILKWVLGTVTDKIPPGFDAFIKDAAPLLLKFYEEGADAPGAVRPIDALKDALLIQRSANDKRLHDKHHPPSENTP